MDNNSEKTSTRFPEEMPDNAKKDYEHGVIESVVKNEIETKSATNPAKPCNNDSLNTEFAKNALNNK